MDGTGTITNCSNYGNVTSENGSAYGIISSATTIDKCFNAGKITANQYGAGICSSSTYIINCINSGTIKTTVAGAAGMRSLTGGTCYNDLNIGDIIAGHVGARGGAVDGVSRYGFKQLCVY